MIFNNLMHQSLVSLFFFINFLNVYKLIENYKQKCPLKANSSPAMLMVVNQYVAPVPWNHYNEC